MIKKVLFLIFMTFLITGCSVKYDEAPVVENKIPEFIFQDASMVHYDDNKVAMEVEAEKLEKYRNSAESYGKGVKFISYDDEGSLDTEGKCDYIFTNTDSDIYELYENIQIKNVPENMDISAEALKYNGKTEQLISTKGDSVKIKKDNTVVKGTGFSASGVSRTYSFSGNVIGSIETE